MNIFLCRFPIGKGCVRRRRNMVFFHDVLSKGLRAFHLRGSLVRAEYGQPLSLTNICQAFRQGNFRADDEHVDSFAAAVYGDFFQIRYGDVDAFGNFRHSGAAGDSV